jgi:hypothetical protein
MKRWIPWLLLLALLLTGCAGSEQSTPPNPDEATGQSAPAETPEPQPYRILGQTRLEDCTLAIHYDDGDTYRCRPLLLEELLANESESTHHTTVSGTELLENERFLALLEELNPEELPPERDLRKYSRRIQPTVYYVLTDQNGKKLFDVGMGWDNKEAGAELIESVNFNGKAILFDERFYFCVEPYLTESHYIPGFCWAGRDGESWIKETQTDPNA